jgi:hypothetical protein
VAEWLRSGLQNRLPRFNSGRGLQHLDKITTVASTKSQQEASGAPSPRWPSDIGQP